MRVSNHLGLKLLLCLALNQDVWWECWNSSTKHVAYTLSILVLDWLMIFFISLCVCVFVSVISLCKFGSLSIFGHPGLRKKARKQLGRAEMPSRSQTRRGRKCAWWTVMRTELLKTGSCRHRVSCDVARGRGPKPREPEGCLRQKHYFTRKREKTRWSVAPPSVSSPSSLCHHTSSPEGATQKNSHMYWQCMYTHTTHTSCTPVTLPFQQPLSWILSFVLDTHTPMWLCIKIKMCQRNFFPVSRL